MQTDQFLTMRWNGIPLAKINNTFKSKIISKLHTRKEWYGHTAEQWLKAFEFKTQAEQSCREDNIKAAHELTQMRRRKEFELQRASYKLLDGICRALNINS